MPLTSASDNLTTRAVPLDAAQQFAASQILTASGDANNVNASVDLKVGRMSGALVLDLAAMKVAAGNETYLFGLIGSSDPAFGAGNCELMACADFAAAAAGRLFPALCGASPVVPQAGESVRRVVIPFFTNKAGFLLRYFKLAALLGGTAPSVTLSSWITDHEALGVY